MTLKKDHTLLSEVLFQCISTMKETLIDLSLSSENYTIIRTQLLHLNMCSLSLLTSYSDEELLHSLIVFKRGLFTTHGKVGQHIPQMDSADAHHVYTTLHSIIDQYIQFLHRFTLSQHTSFHASPFGTPEVIIIDFDLYDQQYQSILIQLYDLSEDLGDWSEDLCKRDVGPVFDDDVFMDDMELGVQC